jgi:hypothetical protein
MGGIQDKTNASKKINPSANPLASDKFFQFSEPQEESYKLINI